MNDKLAKIAEYVQRALGEAPSKLTFIQTIDILGEACAANHLAVVDAPAPSDMADDEPDTSTLEKMRKIIRDLNTSMKDDADEVDLLVTDHYEKSLRKILSEAAHLAICAAYHGDVEVSGHASTILYFCHVVSDAIKNLENAVDEEDEDLQ